jgi:subtilisin family serine protease
MATKSTRKTGAEKHAAPRKPKRAKSAKPSSAPASTMFAASAIAPSAIGSKAARTIIYIHGIANKPPAAVLKCQWDRALFGAELGDRSRMAYWVNRDYYPVPLDESCADGDVVRVDDEEASTRAILALASSDAGTEPLAIEREIGALAENAESKQVLTSIAAKLEAKQETVAATVLAADVEAKILPLPAFLRRLIVGKLTRAFLRDVNDFLFKADRRKAMEDSLLERLSSGGGPFVVVAHSQGTMVAYNLLRRLDPAKFEIPLFVTIGSPLGLQEVQDQLRKWTGGKLPFPACVKRWVNVAERLDPVAFDSDISNDFEGKIENIAGFGLNPDSPQHPHSGTGYLRTRQVRKPVLDTVGTAFGQAIAPFVLAKDLVSDLENGRTEDRHSVLIQLVNEDSATASNLDGAASAIEAKIVELVRAGGGDPAIAKIDRLRRFLAADLTRGEAEILRTLYKDLSIKTVWRNGVKQALIAQSTNTIQARPANIGYGADGRRIAWAVLDTGIRADHPHFGGKTVVEQYDCLKPGMPVRLLPSDKLFATLDGNGHGTHVAGIIAGGHQAMVDDSVETFSGMAPACRLYGFKVLDDEGRGSDAAIIKALDRISSINEEAGRLVIQGVNLSLGGNFDPSVYGCGHTPLCQEIKRLWRQGVLTVLAAGNEGYAMLRSDGGTIQANMDLSIGDPANLEEAIAVGSVHKTNPHTYGISYFSSRGPTADGRMKPDIVAPGERILSARHDWEASDATTPPLENLYVEMSGTSMAAPHVSGLLAAFLSQRREFIGEPDRVKKILLNGCIDLARDRYMQGAGLPNLIKMLALE